jgi:DNA-directed RNA polymerase subunit RPC12/RpoP
MVTPSPTGGKFMAHKAIIVEESICAEDIDPKDIRCPRCHGQTLILKGNHQIAHEEILQDGVIVESKNIPEMHAFEVEIIECTPCSVRFLVKSKDMFQLEKLNFLLRQQVIDLGGADPFGLGRPN